MPTRSFEVLLVVILITSSIARTTLAVNVEHLSQVMMHTPTGATQQQLCWLVENSYIDALSDNTGKTFRTCRFANEDLPAFRLRSEILEVPPTTDAEKGQPWLNLSSYSGPRPFDNETDYCTDIIQYVIQPMYDDQGRHVSEASNAGRFERTTNNGSD